MNPILKTLNALMSVLESFACIHQGEAKGELKILCDNLESDPAYAFEGREPYIIKLREALSMARGAGGDLMAQATMYGYAARLSDVSRDLWMLYTKQRCTEVCTTKIMDITTDSEIIDAVRKAAAQCNMSPSALISLGQAQANWKKDVWINAMDRPYPNSGDEAEIAQEIIDSWPEWVQTLIPVGTKFERLNWPDGSFAVRLINSRGLVLAGVRLPSI